MRKRNETFSARVAEIGRLLDRRFTMAESVALVYATVDSVDEENRTLNAIVDNDKTISDINLDIVVNGDNGILFIPTVEPTVVLGFVENRPELPFVVSFTHLDKIVVKYDFGNEGATDVITIDASSISAQRGDAGMELRNGLLSLTVGSASVALDSSGENPLVTLNGGEKGPTVVIGELTARLNKLVGEIDSLKEFVNSHTHTAPSGGGPTSSPTPGFTGSFSQFSDDEYQNEDIVQ